MFFETISPKYVMAQGGTSEGTQVKYRKGMYWYKEDHLGEEGRVEYLISRLLTFSNLKKDEYILYEPGMINGKKGCRSRNFLQPNMELVTFYRLYQNVTGENLAEVVGAMDTMEERIAYVEKFIGEVCRIDIREYLSKIFFLDMISLNEDRHFNNLAVLYDGNRFRPAPIFDNGVALLTANRSVNWKFPIEENVKRVIARPFSGDHEKMARYFGRGFLLKTDEIKKWLRTEEDTTEKNVLMYQIERYEHLFKIS